MRKQKWTTSSALEIGPLMFTLMDRETHRTYKESDRLQAHEQIIRPLFNASIETYIFRGRVMERRHPRKIIIPSRKLRKRRKPIEFKDELILKRKNGRYIFDKTQECITGHEYLWNATAYMRGSIVMVLKNDFDFSGILKYCYNHFILLNPYAWQSSDAEKLCRKVREKNFFAAVLLASNGVEKMLLYSPDEAFDRIENLTDDLCQSYDEWQV